ncbi:MAG TPA: glycoside hydrolase domain-containing protein, partial [Armatimonadota bacterium]|nr:glycoside hydrolase domain-containing protein [Armatimonadota bacterium]
LTGPRHVPTWVTVQAPADIAPGTYRGRLTVQVTGGTNAAVNVPLEVEVLDFELPFRPSFRTNQQLWGIKRGEVRPWLEELAACRMFDANTWYSDPEELRWRMEELGQNAIKLNLVGGHGNKPVQLEGNDIYSDEYAEIFKQRLARMLESIKGTGWEKYAFIYIWDENWGSSEVFDMVKYLGGLIREQTTEVPILAALPVNENIEGLVNIYLAEYSPDEVIRRRMAAGDEFWRWGNVDMTLGEAPLSVRMSYGFESLRRGFTGAYSWGVSAWRDSDPWVDYDRGNWGGTLFYPGAHQGSEADLPVPSIRMELLRDGIEDFEYVTILRRLVEEKGNAAGDLADRARELIQRGEALSETPSEFRRCDQDIDETLDVRRRIQDTILALQAVN